MSALMTAASALGSFLSLSMVCLELLLQQGTFATRALRESSRLGTSAGYPYPQSAERGGLGMSREGWNPSGGRAFAGAGMDSAELAAQELAGPRCASPWGLDELCKICAGCAGGGHSTPGRLLVLLGGHRGH